MLQIGLVFLRISNQLPLWWWEKESSNAKKVVFTICPKGYLNFIDSTWLPAHLYSLEKGERSNAGHIFYFWGNSKGISAQSKKEILAWLNVNNQQGN